MSSNFLDQLYRKSFENKHVVPSNTTWNDVEKLLNNASPQKKIKNESVLLIITFTILMSSIMLYIIWQPDTKTNKPANTELPAKPYHIPQKKKDLYATSGESPAATPLKNTVSKSKHHHKTFVNNDYKPESTETESTSSLVLAEDYPEVHQDNNIQNIQQAAAIEHQVIINPEFRFRKLNITVKQDMLLADTPEPVYEENIFQEEAGLPSKVLKSLQERATQLYITASERNIIHQ